MGIGRYSDWGQMELKLPTVTWYGASYSPDVYTLSAEVTLSGGWEATLILRFGPQGHSFGSDLSFSTTIEEMLAGIPIELGSVQFGGEIVSVTVGGQVFQYTRSQLDTDLINDIIDSAAAVGLEDLDAVEVAAEKVAEIIGMGMDALDEVSNVAEIPRLRTD